MSQNTKAWFRPKRYGYGFTPISVEGWIATAVFIGVMFFSAYINGVFEENMQNKDGMRFLLDIIMLTFIFFLFAKEKTEGELKWNWGKQ